ncbi:MAG: addiction module antidote protein [Pseudomonadota bacterium]
MKKKSYPPSISHDKLVIAHLRDDPEFAVEYLKVALEEATDEDGRYVLLGAIRRIAEAHGIAKIARAAGIKRESLSRALSAKGNPRLDTLYAVVHAMGLQLTVEPAHERG